MIGNPEEGGSAGSYRVPQLTATLAIAHWKAGRSSDRAKLGGEKKGEKKLPEPRATGFLVDAAITSCRGST